MSKKPFLTSVAVLAASVALHAQAAVALPVTAITPQELASALTTTKPIGDAFVLHHAPQNNVFADHYSHSSHSSHSSHYSSSY